MSAADLPHPCASTIVVPKRRGGQRWTLEYKMAASDLWLLRRGRSTIRRTTQQLVDGWERFA